MPLDFCGTSTRYPWIGNRSQSEEWDGMALGLSPGDTGEHFSLNISIATLGDDMALLNNDPNPGDQVKAAEDLSSGLWPLPDGPGWSVGHVVRVTDRLLGESTADVQLRAGCSSATIRTQAYLYRSCRATNTGRGTRRRRVGSMRVRRLFV